MDNQKVLYAYGDFKEPKVVFEVSDGVIAVKTGRHPKLHKYYKGYHYIKDYGRGLRGLDTNSLSALGSALTNNRNWDTKQNEKGVLNLSIEYALTVAKTEGYVEKIPYSLFISNINKYIASWLEGNKIKFNNTNHCIKSTKSSSSDSNSSSKFDEDASKQRSFIERVSNDKFIALYYNSTLLGWAGRFVRLYVREGVNITLRDFISVSDANRLGLSSKIMSNVDKSMEVTLAASDESKDLGTYTKRRLYFYCKEINQFIRVVGLNSDKSVEWLSDYRNCRCAVNKISSAERHKLGLPY